MGLIRKLIAHIYYRRKRKIIDEKAGTVNHLICAKCGGKCCDVTGCHYSPYDFKEITYEYLSKLIREKRYICIRVIKEKQNFLKKEIYYLKIRDIGDDIVVGNSLQMLGVGCVLSTAEGCRLNDKHRPTGGKYLIPNEFGHCKQYYDINFTAYEWSKSKYQRILKKLFQEFS